MAEPYNVGMYVARIPNRSSPPAFLLRESYREGGKVKNRTLANLSHLPIEQIEQIRRVLKGENLVSPDGAFSIQRSLPHGHVEITLGMIRKLKLDQIIVSRRSRQRDLVVAMVAQRLLFPCSKLATTRHWHSTTLAEDWGSPMPARTSCMRHWIGFWSVSPRSSSDLPSNISKAGRWPFTTSPAATMKVAHAPWPVTATIAMARRIGRSSSTAC